MKAIDRLYQYIEVKGVKPTRFEKDIGLSNGYLGTQLKRAADIGEGVLNKILDYCLDLNPIWLITGKGSMLVGDAPLVADHDAIKAAIYKEELEECRSRLEQLIKENTRLEERLKSVSDWSAFPPGTVAEPAVSHAAPEVPELPGKPAPAGGKLKNPRQTKHDL